MLLVISEYICSSSEVFPGMGLTYCLSCVLPSMHGGADGKNVFCATLRSVQAPGKESIDGDFE
jgi:hypothetical protein